MRKVHPISSHPGYVAGQRLRPADRNHDLARFAAKAAEGLRALETTLGAVASREAAAGNWNSSAKVSKAAALLSLVRRQFTLFEGLHVPASVLDTVVMPLVEALDLLRGAAADLGIDYAPEAFNGTAQAWP